MARNVRVIKNEENPETPNEVPTSAVYLVLQNLPRLASYYVRKPIKK